MRPQTTFSVRTDAFEGPLDLLLTLIQERKFYISEVSLAAVTDDYVAYVGSIDKLPMDETAEFIVVASTLLLIKSRSLLPDLELSEEDEESIEDLEHRLAQYRLYRHAARRIGSIAGRTPLLFGRCRIEYTPVFSPGSLARADIARAATALTTALSTSTTSTAHVAPKISIEEAMATLSRRISTISRLRFSQLREDGASKHDIVVQFLALLELVKGEHIQAEQSDTFADIVLTSDTIDTPRYEP